MLGVVVLAAGASRRMGQNKLLLPWQGSTILAHTLQAFNLPELAGKILVTGHQAEQVQKAALPGWQIVHNPSYLQGQSTSLIAALKVLPQNWSAAIFALGDQPLLQAATVQQLCQAAKNLPQALIVPTYDAKRGNPVLIGKNYWPELLASKGDAGARWLFQQYSGQVQYLPVNDAAILQDIDTPAAYQMYTNEEPNQC